MKAQRLVNVFGFIVVAMFFAALPPPTGAQAQVQGVSVPEAPAPVPAPADFQRRYFELVTLQNLIDQVERESGLKAMRERANAMIQELRAALPPGMLYDPARGTFYQAPSAAPAVPQPAAAPAPEAKMEPKPKAKKP